MIHPKALNSSPSMLPLVPLGGLVGMLLLTALLHLAPAFGLPLIDVPRLIGGLFTTDPTAALWIGFWIYFLLGVVLFGPLMGVFWHSLPGPDVGFTGALPKGIVWGVVLWLATGVLLPLFGVLNRLPALPNPGFFALQLGVAAAVFLLVGYVLFGVAAALVAATGQGISPIDTLGWEGYGTGASRDILPPQPARRRSA